MKDNMHIAPNNKLSNHYRKKKTRRTVWTEDQTVSSSFRQNMETMQEKTGIRMFYEDYLNPGVSFSNNGCPDLFGFCSDMPDNDVNIFSNSVMDAYDNNNGGMAGIEGINNVFGGDTNSLGDNNNVFVEDGVFSELTDNQNVDWTVMTDYKVNSETLTQEYTFKTELNNFDAGEVSSLTIGLSTGVSIPTLSWSGITYSRLVMNIGSQTYTNIESGWNSFEFIKSVDGLTWALGQAIGFDAEVKVTDVGGEITTITLHRDGLFDKAWDFLTEIWNQFVGAITAAAEFAKNMLNAIWNWIVEKVTAIINTVLDVVVSAIDAFITTMKQAIEQAFLVASESAEDAAELIVNAIFSGYFFYTILGLCTAIQVISSLISVYTMGAGALVGKAVSIVTVEIAKALFQSAIAGAVSLAGMSAIVGILYLVKPEDDAFWNEGLGLSIFGVSTAVSRLVLSKFVSDVSGVTREVLGLTAAIIGLFLHVFPEKFASVGITMEETLWIGLALAGIGTLATWWNKDIFDISPISPLKHVEEILSMASLAYCIANTGAYYTAG